MNTFVATIEEEQTGLVVGFLPSLLLALLASAIGLALSLMQMGQQASFPGIFLAPFAGVMTFGMLRRPLPATFRPLWALLGFPLMIGVTIFSIGVLRMSTGGNSSNVGLIVVLVIAAQPFLAKSQDKSLQQFSRMILVGCSVAVAVLAIATCLTVVSAIYAGKGPAYDNLPRALLAGAIGTTTMFASNVLFLVGNRWRPATEAPNSDWGVLADRGYP